MKKEKKIKEKKNKIKSNICVSNRSCFEKREIYSFLTT